MPKELDVAPCDVPEFERCHYELREQLGKGQFSELRIARLLEENRIVVVKILNVDNRLQTSLTNEIRMLCGRTKHPNIVANIGICEPTPGQMGIMREYFDMDLKQFKLSINNLKPIANAVCGLFADVATAMQFIHSKDLTHSHLYSENILIDCTDLTAKVSDLAVSRVSSVVSSKDSISDNTRKYFCPPEILLLKEKQWTQECDIYQYGMLIYETICDDSRNPEHVSELCSLSMTGLQLAKVLDSCLASTNNIPQLSGVLHELCVFEPSRRITFADLDTKWRSFIETNSTIINAEKDNAIMTLKPLLRKNSSIQSPNFSEAIQESQPGTSAGESSNSQPWDMRTVEPRQQNPTMATVPTRQTPLVNVGAKTRPHSKTDRQNFLQLSLGRANIVIHNAKNIFIGNSRLEWEPQPPSPLSPPVLPDPNREVTVEIIERLVRCADVQRHWYPLGRRLNRCIADLDHIKRLGIKRVQTDDHAPRQMLKSWRLSLEEPTVGILAAAIGDLGLQDGLRELVDANYEPLPVKHPRTIFY